MNFCRTGVEGGLMTSRIYRFSRSRGHPVQNSLAREGRQGRRRTGRSIRGRAPAALQGNSLVSGSQSRTRSSLGYKSAGRSESVLSADFRKSQNESTKNKQSTKVQRAAKVSRYLGGVDTLSGQTLQGTLSAVSKPIFGTKY